MRGDVVIHGVEHLEAQAIALQAEVNHLRKVPRVDIAPGVALERVKLPPSRSSWLA
jgi:hypothetical protein